jgi:23S rRNA G2445 N2-methylase RlmL
MQQRKQLGRNLKAIKEVVDKTSKTIRDGRDVVPLQLRDALKACKKKRIQVETKYNNIRDLEIEETRRLEDAKRKHDEAAAKLENLHKQINKCTLNLRSAEKDMNIMLLQGRLRDVGHVDVSDLPYDQRLRLSTLIDQMKEVINEASVNSSP